MIREYKRVCYSYEHGDETLPKLREMVSDNADPEKETIMSYLMTNCVAGCPGIVYDEIAPGKVIGSGHIYWDGTYVWDDVFANYVELYNIPVPKDFREHILQNHSSRSHRHTLLKLIDKIEIENNPYLGYRFYLIIYRNGTIIYRNNADHPDPTTAKIKPEEAAYIIDPIMSDLFCYDTAGHGSPIIDGYHWNLTFYKGKTVIDSIEGWSDEDTWRYDEIKSVIEFIEERIPFKLGYDYMDIGFSEKPK